MTSGNNEWLGQSPQQVLDLVIVGAGLAGLALAASVQQQALVSLSNCLLVEAQPQAGGRILSHQQQGFACDMGPGWVWPRMQPRLARCLAEQQQRVFAQYQEGYSLYQPETAISGQPPQAYRDTESWANARRLTGGMGQLVESFLARLSDFPQWYGWSLQQVKQQPDCALALTLVHSSGEIRVCYCQRLVITAPPRIVASMIRFEPELDTHLLHKLLDVPTWMAGQAKVMVTYPQPFWREAGLSGAALAASADAPLREIFDASGEDGTPAILGGFVGWSVSRRQQEGHLLAAAMIAQLVELFGEKAAKPQAILYRDWATNPWLATPADAVLPNGHPQYGQDYLQQPLWADASGGCVWLGGTETARDSGGYLEGALEAAERVAAQLFRHNRQFSQ
jgi:monoamine oxidase